MPIGATINKSIEDAEPTNGPARGKSQVDGTGMRQRMRPTARMCAIAIAMTMALVLAGAGEASAAGDGPPPAPSFEVTRFEVVGDNPLNASETDALLAPFTGPATGLEAIEDAAFALEEALKGSGNVFHRVIVPPQRASGGVFKLEVLAFTLEEITIQGNEHFDDDNVLRALPMLRPGTAPNSLNVARSLALANDHPSRRVAVFLKESGRRGALAADVRVADIDPFIAYVSASTTGDSQTGRWRATVGAQHSNLFNRDHQVTVGYTTSISQPADVQQFSASYRVPLYGLFSSASAYLITSRASQGTTDVGQISGAGRFWGVSTTTVLSPVGNYNHRVGFAFDDRVFQNDSVFTDLLLSFGITPPEDVRSRPVSLSYQGRHESGRRKMNFNIAYVHNLPFGRFNTDARYADNRIEADATWQAFRFGAGLEQGFGSDWLLRASFNGQVAREAMIPGEQFGIGGGYSVRGFQERELTGESGFQGTFQIESPATSYGVRAIAYVDAGHVMPAEESVSVGGGETIVGLGGGLRWNSGIGVSASLDVAQALEGNDRALGIDTTREGSLLAHANVFFRY